MAKSVKLRQRELSSGNIQLYLDINYNGCRKTESLGITLKSGNDRQTKAKNKEMLELAQSIAYERQKILIEQANGMPHSYNYNSSFFSYYDHCAEERNEGTREVWNSSRTKILEYCGDEHITFAKIDKKFVSDFRNWLLNDAKTKLNKRAVRGKSSPTDKKEVISKNRARSIFSCFCACIHEAVYNEIIPKNPTLGVKKISFENNSRRYLSVEELEKLKAAPCVNEEVKRAFLFGCMTGIRYCDIVRLKWSDVIYIDGRIAISFTQKKTKKDNVVYLTNSIMELIGERGDDDMLLFDLPCKSNIGNAIYKWSRVAGVDPFTFHCSRHTFATLLITRGVDIYTTSKMLGHSSVLITQVYARVIDDKIKNAMSQIDGVI